MFSSIVIVGDVAGLPTRLSLDYSAFEKCVQIYSILSYRNLLFVYRPELIVRRYNSPGILIVTNTMEKFKTTDKEQLLKETTSMVGRHYVCINKLYDTLCCVPYIQVWKDICSGAALTDPSLLTRFHLFTYAVSESF